MLSGKQKGSDAYQITNNEFRDYFINLTGPGDEFLKASNDIKSELDNWLSQELECAFQELNNDISEAEIRIAISQLKSGKSSGEDKLLNEFFVHGKMCWWNTCSNCLILCSTVGYFRKHGVRDYLFRYLKRVLCQMSKISEEWLYWVFWESCSPGYSTIVYNHGPKITVYMSRRKWFSTWEGHNRQHIYSTLSHKQIVG